MKMRCAGYHRAMAEAGYTECVLPGGDAAFEAGMEMAKALYDQKMDAAFCTEDMLALGVMHTLLSYGVQVGKSFGMVGFDNIGFSRQVYPELTTIDQNILAKGEVAARTLLNILKGETPAARQVLPVTMVLRETA
jgi:DNA-binding LacI/PurR family transcriptional regulator